MPLPSLTVYYVTPVFGGFRVCWYGVVDTGRMLFSLCLTCFMFVVKRVLHLTVKSAIIELCWLPNIGADS